jgi:hypothetical protein
MLLGSVLFLQTLPAANFLRPQDELAAADCAALGGFPGEVGLFGAFGVSDVSYVFSCDAGLSVFGRRRRYQHCREAIIFQSEFLIGVSEGVNSFIALGYQAFECMDLVFAAFHSGAQTHDRNLQFGASAQERFHPVAIS